MNGESNRIFRFGEFRLDPNKRILTRGDQTIALIAKAFDLLVFLVENSGVIISKEKILDTVWKDQFVEETNLTVQISGLRRLFGEKKGEYNYIVTIPGKGYKFVAETADDSSVEYSDAGHGPRPIHDQKEIAEKPAMRQPAAKLYTTPRFFLLVLGPLLILICGLVAYNYLSPTPAPPINSVAVLPFVNQNNDDDSEYLSDGISESLIYYLSQLPDLRVMSRNSSSRYKGKEFDSKSVGEELQVQAIVTGRVLVKGDEITVSAELIDARSNSVIWGEQFNRRLTDIFTLQAEMGRAISQRMRSKLTLPQQERVERGAEPNSEAYQLYL